ncbi:transcriptional activator xlnR [Dipodascopsis tothii]|uniref:transcriptional activator xlnR n=1 Tax=Dipodascopsis tothii TaxID=44089 RepID=UPI0034CEE31F
MSEVQLSLPPSLPPAAPAAPAVTATGTARRRISRACDQCNQFRTRCDGKLPCKRCSDLVLHCDYARQLKKRGKGSNRYASTSVGRTAAAPALSPKPLARPPPTFAEPVVANTSPNSSLDSAADDATMADIAGMHADDGSLVSGSPFLFGNFQLKDSTSLLTGLEGFVPELFTKSAMGSPNAALFAAASGPQSPRQVYKLPYATAGPTLHQGGFGGQSAPPPAHMAALAPPPAHLRAGPSLGLGAASSGDHVYPVLRPILDDLHFMAPSLAADLLEVYFSNTIYGIAHFVRRPSILAVDKPARECSPALLFSFLLVAAHVSDHPAMTATPTSRAMIVDRLKELTLHYLRPLEHSNESGSIDDVMAYIHLGIISSASEFKGASLKWWHAAWGLARVLKLNIENTALAEQVREERRRTWWLLFLVDRHLCLCYNRPISVLDCESTELFRPIDNDVWHSDVDLIPAEMDPTRIKGLYYQVTGPDLFGYFLPLMELLGGIDDLHQLELNPTLRATPELLEPLRRRVRFYLDAFARSLDAYDEECSAKENGGSGARSRLSPSTAADDELGAGGAHTASPGTIARRPLTYGNCWKEYCRCLIHVFHILVAGYWDPIDLLALPPTMVLDSEFASVVGHSLEAVNCIKRILDADQDLRIIPFFFGIQMLQASFTLLYLADVLGGEDVRHACETIVRAHEVCIVTLNTEYQRNFRQIMRGALQSMRHDRRFRHRSPLLGHAHDLAGTYASGPLAASANVAAIAGDIQQRYMQIYGPDGEAPDDGRSAGKDADDGRRRRLDLLALYRWGPGGNGLAV